MAEPYASSLITILQGTLNLIERSRYLTSDSQSIEQLREAIQAVTSELEVFAKREPHSEAVPEAEDVYKPRIG